MVSTFFDSSVLVAAYVSQQPSDAARRAIMRVSMVPYTPLHHLEVRNAIRLLVGWKRLTAAESSGLLSHVDHDVSVGRLKKVPLDLHEMFSRAETLSERHASQLLSRSLDTLHVAAALELGCTRFVTLDARQARLAAACGLKATDLSRKMRSTRRT